MKETLSVKTLTFTALGIAALAAVGLTAFVYVQNQELIATSDTVRTLESTRDNLLQELEVASTTRVGLEDELNALKDEFGILTTDYESERNRNEVFNDQIRNLGETVGVLDKLARTDEELLQKYSKVSFLNEHYVPERLSEIADEWKYTESRSHQLHSNVMPYFEDMLEAAKADGIELWVVSAYRSFEQQAQIKGQFLVTYGSGANAFSADQGFSEHQLGTTLDFTTRGLGGGLDGFGSTPAYTWLQENAHKYGFTLSYPDGNAFYVYEPWHWRFVGTKLARDLNREGATIYDWDQRKIDEYLINIFD